MECDQCEYLSPFENQVLVDHGHQKPLSVSTNHWKKEVEACQERKYHPPGLLIYQILLVHQEMLFCQYLYAGHIYQLVCEEYL